MIIDIDKRSFNFALRIVQLVNSLPKTLACRIVAGQLIRSGTSIGANIEEALGGHTKADFIHCINIAKKEARESRYWLKILVESSLLDNEDVRSLISEADELVAILTTIVKNSKLKK